MNANSAPLLTAIPVPPLRCYLSADADTAPSEADESTEWELLRIERTAGFARPDTIVMRRRQTGRIVDRSLHQAESRQVEVWFLDLDGTRLMPLAWGETSRSQLVIPATGDEQEVLLATIEPRHFGPAPIDGMRVWDQADEEVTTLHLDLVVNPRVDEQTIGNRGREVENFEDAPESHYVFLHHEAARTDGAKLAHNDSAQGIPGEWTLRELLDHLAWEYNTAETRIKNPQLTDAQQATPRMYDQAPQPDGEVIRRGTWLAEAFDQLLAKYGYNCRVDLTLTNADGDPDDAPPRLPQRRVQIFQRGQGTHKALRLQAVGADVDPAKSHLADTSLEVSLVELANTVRGQGSLIQREVTLPLWPAWSTDDDDIAASDLVQGGTGYETHREVRRKYVLNTDGTYNDVRPEHGSEPVDLTSLGDAFKIPRRRPIAPPLTYALKPETAEQSVRDTWRLQWRKDSEAEWQEWVAKTGAGDNYQVLKDECGIYFDEQRIPQVLVDHEEHELRITGTLTGDLCVESVIANPGTGPQGTDVELLLDLSQKFHERTRQEDGDYASILDGDGDFREDEDALQAYCEKVRDVEDAAQMTAQLNLYSLRIGYQIGDLITEIDGRRINLSRTTAAAAAPKYLQIVGITYDYEALATILTVEPFDVVVG